MAFRVCYSVCQESFKGVLNFNGGLRMFLGVFNADLMVFLWCFKETSGLS